MPPKPPPPPARAEIAPGIVLDSRLAIFHERDRWLVCADLHLGYEVNRRRGGGLFPLWGFAATAERLLDLADFYRPAALILAGDIVDGGGAAEAAADLLQRAGSRCGDVICLAGNHDRGPIRRAAAFADSFAASGFYFHHGHREAGAADLADQIEVVGHAHPAISINDGAGLRLRAPAFVQAPRRWTLPAFSPWAGGGRWKPTAGERLWICHPQRVFEWRD